MKQLPFLMLMAAGIAAASIEAFAHQVQTNYVIDAQTRNTLEVQSVFRRGLKTADFGSHSQPKIDHRRRWPSLLIDSISKLSGTA